MLCILCISNQYFSIITDILHLSILIYRSILMSSSPIHDWERYTFLTPKRLTNHINEFQFQNYIQTRGEAVRRLIKSGLLREARRGNYFTDAPLDFEDKPPELAEDE